MTHREDEYDYLFKGKWTKRRIFFFFSPLSYSPNPPRVRTTCVNKCHLMPTCRWTFLLGGPSLRQEAPAVDVDAGLGSLGVEIFFYDTWSLSHLASNLFPQDSPTTPVVVVWVHLLCGRIVSDDDDDAIMWGCGFDVENQFIGERLWSLVESFIVLFFSGDDVANTVTEVQPRILCCCCCCWFFENFSVSRLEWPAMNKQGHLSLHSCSFISWSRVRRWLFTAVTSSPRFPQLYSVSMSKGTAAYSWSVQIYNTEQACVVKLERPARSEQPALST